MSENKFEKTALTDNILLLKSGQTLDNNNAHLFADELAEARKKGFRHVIVDMTELEFLSSAGVGSILGSIEDFRDNSGDIILFNLSPNIAHVLSVLDLDSFFTVKSTKEEALAVCK